MYIYMLIHAYSFYTLKSVARGVLYSVKSALVYYWKFKILNFLFLANTKYNLFPCKCLGSLWISGKINYSKKIEYVYPKLTNLNLITNWVMFILGFVATHCSGRDDNRY